MLFYIRYAKYLWLKEKKFIPFPYILLNSSILLNKCYDTIFPLLNKESLKINFFLLKNYVAKYQQHPVLRIWGDGMNIGGLNKVLSKSTEEQSGVMISKEGMRRSDTLFDEQFQGFGLEDWEFAYRLSKIHGYSITFDPSIKTTQYDDFKRTQNPFKNLNQNDINLYIKNALYFIEKYPEDKCLHKDLIKFVSKFAYSQKNQKFERIYVDFDELAKKDVNDIIKNYALLTKYKSKLK